MSVYGEFVRNPWNFLFRTLMIRVDEKSVESMVKDGLSDLNYRSLLLYVNNARLTKNDELNYDVLRRVDNFTVIMYIFDLDAYIIDSPFGIDNSSMSNITVITKQCSNSYDVVKEKSIYGLCNIYSIMTRTFKVVYNAYNSTVYIEGNKSSQFHLFQRIDRWIGKASMRIYSTLRYDKAKPRFVNPVMPPAIPIAPNTQPMYKTIQVRNRVMENHSYGIDLLNKIFDSDKFTAASLYTKVPVYKTGISVVDLSNIDSYLTNKRIGTMIDRSYDNNIKSYSNRSFTYGTFIILKDCLIGLFVGSNSRTPFEGIGHSKQSVFVYMNHYCYYIGRTYLSYTFTGKIVSIADRNNSSSLNIDVDDMSYTIYGDFNRSCNKALISGDITSGFCRQYLYKDIHSNLNLVYK